MYLDDVGINRKLLERINNTHDDLQQLVKDKLEFASNQVSRKIIQSKIRELRTLDVIEHSRVGYLSRTRQSVSAKTGYWAGAMIETRQDREYVKIAVSGINLFTQTTGDVDVRIYDLNTGVLLDTITVSCIAGQNSYKDVDKVYTSDKRTLSLGFVYESTFASYKTTTLEGGCLSCGGYRKQIGALTYAQGVKISSGSDFLVSNVTSVGETSGLSVTYSLMCDYEKWVCGNRNALQLAVLYATAHEIALHGLRSDLNNPATMEERDTLAEIRDWTAERMNEEINGALDGMPIPHNEYCFRCHQKTRHVTTL